MDPEIGVDNETQLKIKILPPFWRTKAAYIIYMLAAGGTLLLIRKRGIQRIRKEFVLEQERQQAKRMHDLDLMKIKFLTNVSHEFRTPLSLIITPLDKIIKQAKSSERPQLQMIQRNGKRLLNLVNQLLDFRKMEEQELKLHPKTGNIIQFIKELSHSFSDVADRKNISLQFEAGPKAPDNLFFDHDKVERILFNLLSNAFKFTGEGGKISIKLEVQTYQKGMVKLLLIVSDNGIGIPDDKQEKIFERFFHSDVPDSMVNQGSGIGLSITKEFVRLQGGTIHVQSVLNEGSTFTVTFFLLVEETEKNISAESQLIQITALQERLAADPGFIGEKKKPVLMLLIEDNEDFRFYLKDNLKEHYQITEVDNGLEGWKKVLSSHPDLIVTDISMPGMNGVDLCKKIKSDKRTAHIPVILLTAMATENQQITGLEAGASDYITKPFNFEILRSKIRNLLQQQAISKKTYKKQVEFKPLETEIESVDDKFIRQLSLHLEKHLSDTTYSVDQLSAKSQYEQGRVV
ncbi:ATP-binding response regulator [Pedobacter sp. NJ-S-72]